MRWLTLVLAGAMACGQTPAPQAVKPKTTSIDEPEDSDPDREASIRLAKVKRVYVDLLTGGDSALKIRDLLMTSLQSSKLFIITENEERADAVLRGAGQDSAFTDTFQSSEGLNVKSQIGIPTDEGSSSRYSNRTTAGISVGENESRRSEERKHEAIATVRLVLKDGDVIWSTTQESLGGKFLGAAADVADKVARKLAVDMRRARAQELPLSPALLKSEGAGSHP